MISQNKTKLMKNMKPKKNPKLLILKTNKINRYATPNLSTYYATEP
jgi:hypothetical protein